MIGAMALVSATAGHRRVQGGIQPSLFSFELLDETGLSTFTDIPALRVRIQGGAWQTLAAAGLTLYQNGCERGHSSPASRRAPMRCPLTWHYEQQQPGEPYTCCQLHICDLRPACRRSAAREHHDARHPAFRNPL